MLDARRRGGGIVAIFGKREKMDNLRAGVVEYEPLPFRYPLETYSEYVLRNVADYERMTADAVKEVMKQPTCRRHGLAKWITHQLLQALNVLVFPEYGLTGLVCRFLSRKDLEALVKGLVHLYMKI